MAELVSTPFSLRGRSLMALALSSISTGSLRRPACRGGCWRGIRVRYPDLKTWCQHLAALTGVAALHGGSVGAESLRSSAARADASDFGMGVAAFESSARGRAAASSECRAPSACRRRSIRRRCQFA